MKYFSETLNKYFDTEVECVKAEKQHELEEAKKADLKVAVRKEAEVVNQAFAARNEARKAYNEKATEAYKTYLEAIKKAREEYENSIQDVKTAKRTAEAEFDKKYREFDKNHPEGYRLVLKDGDDVLTVEQDKKCNYDTLFEDMDRFFNSFFKLW